MAVQLITVTNDPKDAQWKPLPFRTIKIALSGGARFDDDGAEVVASTTTSTDSSGNMRVQLEPNAGALAGTSYTFTSPWSTWTAVVPAVPNPNSADGSYTLNEILAVPPNAPEAAFVVVRADVDQTAALTEAQKQQARANIGVTDAQAAVNSFNGRTGAIEPAAGDYTAADVGADAAGTAAAAVAAEQARAENAESANATAIAAEATRAQNAESANATAIANETTRAENAEATNATAIANEKTRAQNAEANALSWAAAQALSTAQASQARANAGLGATTDAPVDGQLYAWSSAAGKFILVNPSGSAQLADVDNATNTPQTFSAVGGTGANGAAGAIQTLTGMTISVGDSGGRPVVLHYGCSLLQTVAGIGTFFLLLYETTGGASTQLDFDPAPLPNNIATGTNQAKSPGRSKDIGVVSGTRTFKLQGYIWAAQNQSPSAQVVHGSTSASYLRAIAG